MCMDTKKSVTLWQLFCRSFLLSGTTIGGGFVILSAMDRMYVQRLGWLREEEMLDIVSLAQSSPGAVAVNASLLAGAKLRGTFGAAAALLGCILPPFTIMCVLGSMYGIVSDSTAVSVLLPFVKIGIGLFLSRIAFSLCRKHLITRYGKTVFTISLTAILFCRIQSIWLLIASAVLAVIRYYRRKYHE